MEVKVLRKEHGDVVVSLKQYQYRLLLALKGNIIVAVNPKIKWDTEYHVALAKEVKENAYEEFLRVLGKLTLKSPESKYYAYPIKEEHMVNGSCSSKHYDEIVCIARSAVECLYGEVLK